MSSEGPPANVLSDLDPDESYDEAFDGNTIKDEDGTGNAPLLIEENNDEPQVDQSHDDNNVLEDGIVDMSPPQLQPGPHIPVVRRIVRRIRVGPDGEGPSHNSGQPKKIYVRRKRTPAEELAMGRYDGEMMSSGNSAKRIPAPPGKRGRRPIMLPHDTTEPLSRTEAARRSGRPIVLHPSGVAFAIPSSLEAHPIQLSDTIPDNPAFDILKDDEGMPYCSHCHSVLRSFHALEYHIMSVHLKYRPFRCMFCVKEYFYTEEECVAHLKSVHIGKPMHIIRELKEDKEEQLTKFFQTVFLMVREGEELTQERVDGLQQAAFHQMQKYHRMRFKVPEVVARQRSQRDAAAQTFVTMAAPQTMVQMPLKSQYVRREPLMSNVKVVQLPNGDIVQQILATDQHRYIVDRDLESTKHTTKLMLLTTSLHIMYITKIPFKGRRAEY